MIFERRQSFYPTYKEWKHSCSAIYSSYFQPFYPTYKEWKLRLFQKCLRILTRLFILPIRNGNYFWKFIVCFRALPFYPTYKEWKPPPSLPPEQALEPFYPTYKEWKHHILFLHQILLDPFYPTYKEWKRKIGISIVLVPLPFYPTYKEWKHFLYQLFFSLFFLFILPIRNGNELGLEKIKKIMNFLSYL